MRVLRWRPGYDRGQSYTTGKCGSRRVQNFSLKDLILRQNAGETCEGWLDRLHVNKPGYTVTSEAVSTSRTP